MHKRNTPGFTLVELVIVMVLIAFLTTIGIVAYSKVLKDSHDSKRHDDITALSHELEKYYAAHGEYPAGCTAPNTSNQCVTYGGPTSHNDPSSFNTSNTTQITPTLSLTQLRQILPGINSTFGDPVNTDTTPILSDTNNSAFEYIYFGGLTNATSSTQTYNLWPYSNTNQPWILPISCNPAFTLAPGQTSSFIVGYYGESDKIWHLFHGLHGAQPSYQNQTPDTQMWCWNTGANAQWDN